MTDTPKIRTARTAVEARKTVLIDTVRELQQRLQPRTLASDAWEAAKNKGADLAEDAVDAVKSRPVAAGGVVAALALFLARDPIKDAARRLYDGMTSSDDEPDEPNAKPTVSPARRKTRTSPRPKAVKTKATKPEKLA